MCRNLKSRKHKNCKYLYRKPLNTLVNKKKIINKKQITSLYVYKNKLSDIFSVVIS